MKKKDLKLDQEIKALNEQLLDLDDKFKRALADYQNQEKRHSTQRSQIIKLANESLLDKLLPILDDLERAHLHLKDHGLSQIIKQFHQVLKAEGLTEIDSDNAHFNPETMDCAEVVEGPKNQVVKTILKGYLYSDRVLRPAKVEVGSGLPSSKVEEGFTKIPSPKVGEG